MAWKHLGALVAGCLFLSACQMELYSKLSEKEANEMIAVLLTSNIEASKESDKDGMITLLIAKNDFGAAMSLLKNHGLPRTQFTNIGAVYKKEGLISSPAEERARFLFARSQELSATLSELEGVISARVHIAVPEQKSLVTKSEPPSASVWIWHRSDALTDALVPQIKTSVAFSVEELEYDQVSVFLNPIANAIAQQLPATVASTFVAPASVSPQDKYRYWQTLIGTSLGVFGLLLLCATIALCFRKSKQRRKFEALEQEITSMQSVPNSSDVPVSKPQEEAQKQSKVSAITSNETQEIA